MHNKEIISFTYGAIIFAIYISSKIIGYIILPYSKFKVFIQALIDNSKVGLISGFEIFKTTLVILLFLGFIFIDPSIWIIESILVIVMRIWGYLFFKSLKK